MFFQTQSLLLLLLLTLLLHSKMCSGKKCASVRKRRNFSYRVRHKAHTKLLLLLLRTSYCNDEMEAKRKAAVCFFFFWKRMAKKNNKSLFLWNLFEHNTTQKYNSETLDYNLWIAVATFFITFEHLGQNHGSREWSYIIRGSLLVVFFICTLIKDSVLNNHTQLVSNYKTLHKIAATAQLPIERFERKKIKKNNFPWLPIVTSFMKVH